MPMSDRLRAIRDAVFESTQQFDTYALGTMLIIVIYHNSREPLESLFHVAAAATMLIRRVPAAAAAMLLVCLYAIRRNGKWLYGLAQTFAWSLTTRRPAIFSRLRKEE